MRLLLTITSEERRQLGHRARHEFDHSGGIIGRNAACAWVVPDLSNMISARHATIAYNGRGFEITDTSTNGVYLNTVDAPIGRGNTAFLTHGDTLYFGSFVVSVETSEDSTEERRRLGVGQMAVAIKGDRGAPSSPAQARSFDAMPPDLDLGQPYEAAGGYAPPPAQPSRIGSRAEPRAAGASMDALFGGGAPEPPPAPRVTPAPAVNAPAAPQIPVGFAAATPAPAAAPGPMAIPHDILADILGAPGQKAGAPPGGFSTPPNLSGAGADPFGFGPRAVAPAAAPLSTGAARTSIIPDTLDFADLLAAPLSKPQSASPGLAASPAPIAPRAPKAFATPLLDLGDLGRSEPAPVAPAQPPQGPPLPQQAPLPQEPSLPQQTSVRNVEQPPARPSLSAALSADMVSLRPPGAVEEPAGPRALDPVAVLRQRAAAGPANLIAPMPLPGARQPPGPAPAARSSIPLAQPSDDRAPGAQGDLAEAFWNGVGLDPAQIPPEMRAEILTECGRALREAVNGLTPVLAARRSLKDEFRMDQTRLQPKENNPLKFLPSGEAVLQALIERKLTGFLPLSQAIREGFNDIRAHEVAAVVALDAVIKNLLARFDPAAMDAQGGTAKLFGRGPDKTKLWDNFVRLHAGLAGNLEETTRKVVGEEFARAYAQQVESARRGDH